MAVWILTGVFCLGLGLWALYHQSKESKGGEE